MTKSPHTRANLVKGAEFFRVSPDEFGEINKAANKKGLMALVFELDGQAGDPDMKISFELIEAKEEHHGTPTK